MREDLMRRMETADSIRQQFGLSRFDEDSYGWWPDNMRRNYGRQPGFKPNGGSRATQVRSHER